MEAFQNAPLQCKLSRFEWLLNPVIWLCLFDKSEPLPNVICIKSKSKTAAQREFGKLGLATDNEVNLIS